MDTRLKERLVGAVALVLIVVLVVPELLTGPRRTPPPAAAEGPAQVRTVVVDLAQSESGTAPRPAADATPVLAPVPAAAPEASAAPPAGDGTTVAPPALAAAPPVRNAAAPAAGPATPPAATVAEAGKPAAKADVARPEAPKNDAPKTEPARGVAAKAALEAPKVLAVEPPKPAPAEVPKAAPAEAPKPTSHPPKAAVAAGEGWVVQLGSFASRENGEKLAKVLHAKGYRAFVSEFRGNGRILYRVRVGPEQDRSRAEAIAARLSRDGYKGSVAPH